MRIILILFSFMMMFTAQHASAAGIELYKKPARGGYPTSGPLPLVVENACKLPATVVLTTTPTPFPTAAGKLETVKHPARTYPVGQTPVVDASGKPVLHYPGAVVKMQVRVTAGKRIVVGRIQGIPILGDKRQKVVFDCGGRA